jgi:hypothetical protein
MAKWQKFFFQISNLFSVTILVRAQKGFEKWRNGRSFFSNINFFSDDVTFFLKGGGGSFGYHADFIFFPPVPPALLLPQLFIVLFLFMPEFTQGR